MGSDIHLVVMCRDIATWVTWNSLRGWRLFHAWLSLGILNMGSTKMDPYLASFRTALKCPTTFKSGVFTVWWCLMFAVESHIVGNPQHAAGHNSRPAKPPVPFFSGKLKSIWDAFLSTHHLTCVWITQGLDGLLGVAGTITDDYEMDHSRKFPMFSTSTSK